MRVIFKKCNHVEQKIGSSGKADVSCFFKEAFGVLVSMCCNILSIV